MKSLFAFLLILILGSLCLPAVAQAQYTQQSARLGVDQLPPTRIVGENRNQLLQRGCQRQAYNETTTSFLLSPELPYPVLPSDIAPGEVFFCSEETIQTLEVQGQVLGIWSSLRDAVKGIGSAIANIGQKILLAILTAIAEIISWVAKMLNWALHFVASFVVPLLTYGSFIRNPIVSAGWPFVLGIANLGFVLALLYIALTTVLRIGGGDTRRLLVRLLLAALLINFSLLIGGLIIDASRLVMAVIARSLTSRDISYLSVELLKRSSIFTQAFELADSNDPLGMTLNRVSDNPLRVGIATIMIFFVTTGFIALFVGLLIRWVMLILLLIASPLAYLFIALPGTGHLAKKWWDMFIRYVLYAPVAVFILSLLVNLSATAQDTLEQQFGGVAGTAAMVVITTAFLWGAALSGKYVGAAAAGAAGGFIAGRARGFTTGAGRGALTLGGQGALGLGRSALGINAARKAQEQYKSDRTAYRNSLAGQGLSREEIDRRLVDFDRTNKPAGTLGTVARRLASPITVPTKTAARVVTGAPAAVATAAGAVTGALRPSTIARGARTAAGAVGTGFRAVTNAFAATPGRIGQAARAVGNAAQTTFAQNVTAPATAGYRFASGAQQREIVDVNSRTSATRISPDLLSQPHIAANLREQLVRGVMMGGSVSQRDNLVNTLASLPPEQAANVPDSTLRIVVENGEQHHVQQLASNQTLALRVMGDDQSRTALNNRRDAAAIRSFVDSANQSLGSTGFGVDMGGQAFRT